jgi:ABC-type branched-subunit amino acid transport system substrate-binding protein
LPWYNAAVDAGIKKDGDGFYDVFQSQPQSALTPVVQAIKDNNSTFAYSGSGKMLDLRKEAALQGVTSVKVWGCTQGCYTRDIIEQGGADVEDTQSVLFTLPFFSEYSRNPTLKKLVKAAGGIESVDSNAVQSWLAALLFQDVAEAAAKKATLTRATLFDALKQEHSFDANGITGVIDIANHGYPACFVMTQIKNGEWVRTYPSKPGTFDCNKRNLTEVKLDLG